MTFRSRTLKSLMIGLAVLALSATAASATPMTYQERQAIASRGVGAPTPPVVLAPGGRLASAAPTSSVAPSKSSDSVNWGAVAAFIGAALAACVALLAVGRRRTARYAALSAAHAARPTSRWARRASSTSPGARQKPWIIPS